MKIAALLFFVQNLPLVLFITTLLYGGFSTTVLKDELAKSGMYEKVISFVKESDATQGEIDPVFAILQNHLNSDYLQTKTEGVIDDTALWVTGKTDVPPVLSFKDIKDEITATNPTLLTDIQQMSQEMQTAAAETGEMTVTNQPNELETFIKNDFSIPLKDTFVGIKQVYIGLTIALPVLIVLLILSLVGLWFWNPTLHKRLKWFGITFLLTGVLGVITILFNQGASKTSLEYLLKQQDQMIQIVYPLIERILILFVNQYIVYLTIANYVFFAAGMVCLGLSFIIKSPTPTHSTSSGPTAKPTAKKSR